MDTYWAWEIRRRWVCCLYGVFVNVVLCVQSPSVVGHVWIMCEWGFAEVKVTPVLMQPKKKQRVIYFYFFYFFEVIVISFMSGSISFLSNNPRWNEMRWEERGDESLGFFFFFSFFWLPHCTAYGCRSHWPPHGLQNDLTDFFYFCLNILRGLSNGTFRLRSVEPAPAAVCVCVCLFEWRLENNWKKADCHCLDLCMSIFTSAWFVEKTTTDALMSQE